jgi:NitT/TauT family transport system substrate-binding protein
MHKLIDKYNFNEKKFLSKIQRMPPPKIVMALKAGKIDAGFCCEQFPSIGEKNGFKILLNAKDLWPNMQGSVLVVKNDLIKNHPEIVKKLVKVTKKGLNFIKTNPKEASEIVSNTLNIISDNIFPLKLVDSMNNLQATPEIINFSLTTQMICTELIDKDMVQETIDYIAKLGYIKTFNANDILYLKHINNEK